MYVPYNLLNCLNNHYFHTGLSLFYQLGSIQLKTTCWNMRLNCHDA